MPKEEIKFGFGYDTHRYKKGLKLFLGGALIPYTHGMLGHSDGDLVLHAICDGALGAVCAGEIGEYFPPSDQSIKGISSVVIAKKVLAILKKKGAQIIHIDVTLVAETPKMRQHYLTIRKSLDSIFKIGLNNISFKAKSHEGLGDIGAGKALSCFAAVTVKIKNK